MDRIRILAVLTRLCGRLERDRDGLRREILRLSTEIDQLASSGQESGRRLLIRVSAENQSEDLGHEIAALHAALDAVRRSS